MVDGLSVPGNANVLRWADKLWTIKPWTMD